MKNVENHRFKNEASQRFHDYFHAFVKNSKDDRNAFYEAFGLSEQQNPSQFFAKLRSGALSVTLDHVYRAKEAFNMNPGYWFAVSNQQQLGYESMLLNDPNENQYYSPGKDNKRVGNALHEILRRHGTEIKSYAEKRLKITEQSLHRLFRGDTTPSFWVVLQICEDHGESLEQLRSTPLPEGHHLSKIQMLEERVSEQVDIIKLLKEQLREQQGKERRASA